MQGVESGHGKGYTGLRDEMLCVCVGSTVIRGLLYTDCDMQAVIVVVIVFSRVRNAIVQDMHGASTISANATLSGERSIRILRDRIKHLQRSLEGELRQVGFGHNQEHPSQQSQHPASTTPQSLSTELQLQQV